MHPFKTWIALSLEFSGIVHGNANDDDFGFDEIQPGFVDGQGLIFLQEHRTGCMLLLTTLKLNTYRSDGGKIAKPIEEEENINNQHLSFPHKWHQRKNTWMIISQKKPHLRKMNCIQNPFSSSYPQSRTLRRKIHSMHTHFQVQSPSSWIEKMGWRERVKGTESWGKGLPKKVIQSLRLHWGQKRVKWEGVWVLGLDFENWLLEFEGEQRV